MEPALTPPYTAYSSLAHLDNLENDIQKCINSKLDFVGFVLIALGMEFMGMLMDTLEPNRKGESEARFTKAITELFKIHGWYAKNHTLLYKDFRGPLIHQYRVGQKIFLTSECVQKASRELHLKRDKDGKYVFVVEQLFDDFKDAKERLKKRLERETVVVNGKQLSDFLNVLLIASEGYPTFNASGVTSTYSYIETQPKTQKQRRYFKGNSKYHK